MDEMTLIGECYNYTGLDFGYDSHCDVVALDLVCDGKRVSTIHIVIPIV